MRLEGRFLSIGLIGEDVALLQRELAQLGYGISAEEAEPRVFGPGTEGAVRAFQQHSHLQPTGIVDAATAAAINAAIDGSGDSGADFVVRGHILLPPSGAPRALRVRAFDQDLRHEDEHQPHEELLGEVQMDGRRNYEIHYTAEQFRGGERASADLIVRVVDAHGHEVAASSVVPNAPRVVTVDVSVPEVAIQRVSEYQKLVTELAPVLKARAPADLTDEDIAFLVAETGISPERLQIWRTAERLGREVSLSPELFYGLYRERFPSTLDELAALDPDRLRTGVRASVDAGFVDIDVTKSVDALVALLRARRTEALPQDVVPRSAKLRLLDASTGRPMAGAFIRVVDLTARGGARAMGVYVTGDDGDFEVSYATKRRKIGMDADAGRPIRLELLEEGANIFVTNPPSAEAMLPSGADTERLAVDVRIDFAFPAERRSTPLDAVMRGDGRQIPDEVRAAVLKLGVRTLADLRRVGGLPLPTNATPDAAEAASRLNAHATLELLSPDTAVNERLIGMGYAGPADIARSGRSSFVASARELVGDYAASEIHAGATGLVHFGDLLAVAGRSAAESPSSSAGLGGDEACGCDECHVATSPLAYLADLLRYTLQHVAVDDTSLRLSDLETKVFQPFSSMPDSCDSMDRVVLQARLAIEVLHRYLAAHPASSPDAAQLALATAQYLRAAYRALLVRLGTSEEELRVARRETDAQRTALAGRLGVPLTQPRPVGGDELDELTIVPTDLTEERLEQVFGLARTTPDAPTAAMPRIETLRVAHLHKAWALQDWPGDTYSPAVTGIAPPVVDPDLVGPDDFRLGPAGLNPAFSLWLDRRAQMDAILADLRVKVPALRSAPPANLDAEIAADTTATVAKLTTLVDQLMRASRAEADAATQALSALGLSAEGARRLMALRAKHALARPGTTNPPLTPDDWADVVGILGQSRKTAFFAAWREAESLKGITLGPALFWAARREPAEGEWPPRDIDGSVLDGAPEPMIDPDHVRLQDLPESIVGKRSSELWHKRRAQLDELIVKLSALRADKGVDTVLTDVFGAGIDVNLLDIELGSADPAVEATARASVAALLLTVDDFRRVAAFRRFASASAATSTPGVASAEWNAIVAILAKVRKRKTFYSVWLAEERGPTSDKRLRYWEARKAMLPVWRASGDVRQQWRVALRHRSQRPNLDPDVLRPEDFASPVAGNPAYDLYKGRSLAAAGWFTTLVSPESRAAGLRTIVARELGMTSADLGDVLKAGAAGEDVSGRVGQLDLSIEAFRRLIRLDALAAAPAGLEPENWEELANILVQVRKTRMFGAWNGEERAKSLFLGPPHFVVPDDATRAARVAHPVDVSTWRAPLDARMSWDDRLGARVEQEQSVRNAIVEAVSAAEGQTLGLLRDALIDAVPGLVGDLNTKATWLTRRLFIDMKAGLCQRTTRVGQAIETLQSILLVARSRVVSALGGPTTSSSLLRLSALTPIADEEWKWIGSYATWRPAMFAFLYPENIVIPSLRPRQTEPFRMLVDELRSGQRVTPTIACEVADRYQEYFADVCTLSVDASCQVMTAGPAESACTVGTADRDLSGASRMLVHLIARAGATGRVYWATYDPEGHGPQRMTFWERVPALESLGALEIIGAVAYTPSTGGRFLYLFVLGTEKGTRNLYYTRYDLEQARWEGPPAKQLDLPPRGISLISAPSVRIVQWRTESERPRLVFHYHYGGVYERELDAPGERWTERSTSSPDPWAIYQTAVQVWHWKEKEEEKDGFVDSLSGVVDRLNAVVPMGESNEKWGRSAPKIYCYTDKRGELCVVKGDVASKGPNKTSFGRSTFLGMFNATGGAQLFYRADALDGRVHQAVFGWTTSALKQYEDESPSPDQDFDGVGVATVAVRPATVEFFAAVHRSSDAAPHLLGCRGSMAGLQVRELACLAPTMVDASLVFVPPIVFDTVAAQCPLGLEYVKEAFYFVPVQVALQLERHDYYDEALAWFRRVYDFTLPLAQRKLYPGLRRESSLAAGFKRPENWLRDPLNPHAIAETRRYSYTRYTQLAIMRCLLGNADAEFTRDTVESLPRARMLYQQVLDLSDTSELRSRLDGCADMIGNMKFDVPVAWIPTVMSLTRELVRLPDVRSVTNARDAVISALAEPGDTDARIEQARSAVAEAIRAQPPPRSLAEAAGEDARARGLWTLNMLRDPGAMEGAVAAVKAVTEEHLRSVAAASGLTPAMLREEHIELPWLRDTVPVGPAFFSGKGFALGSVGATVRSAPGPAYREYRPMSSSPDAGYAPTVSFTKCIAPNPVIDALRQRAALNLHKLRTCRNIAGMPRQLDLYAAATDLSSGIPLIGSAGVLMLPGISVLRPTPYRYATLVERAKQLVALAQQAESLMLNALERRDAEAYSLLQARQQLGIAKSGVQLQTLRVRAAEDSVTLAERQQERAQVQENHYQHLLDAGWLFEETAQIVLLFGAMAAEMAAAEAKADTLVGVPDALQATASALQIGATVSGIFASHERQVEDWQFQHSLAMQEVRIGAQQVTVSKDNLQVVGQERQIAQLQADHAEAAVEFLANKFTGFDLYDWMSGVLRQVYRYFLQQATAMSKLAATQLAYERQELPPAVIQDDYWSVGSKDVIGVPGRESQPDRSGLTGSARLLKDLYQLDQYAFETNRRKLQLTKTLSLAQHVPLEFEQFRRTGVMLFATPMEMFDRDFPGHYLRTLRRVRMSVVALIPPTQGIRATLSNVGSSRVTIAGDVFQTIPVWHAPQSVALSSPRDATGLFELDMQPELMLPFEGIGVDTRWELRMPKAANAFNYDTLADVLITFDYTALYNVDYRDQVVQTMRPSINGERPFSFRHQFADQWYDLHNPDQSATRMVVRFRTTRGDFPPNLDNVRIQHLLLYFVRGRSGTFEVPVTALKFTEEGGEGFLGGGTASVDGVISTRRGNAGGWTPILGRSPLGEWELAFPDTDEVRAWFRDELITEILFDISYSGRTPAWPA